MTEFTSARLAELRAVAEYLQDAPQGASKCDEIGRSSFDFTPKFESDGTFHRTAAFFENLPETLLALIAALEAERSHMQSLAKWVGVDENTPSLEIACEVSAPLEALERVKALEEEKYQYGLAFDKKTRFSVQVVAARKERDEARAALKAKDVYVGVLREHLENVRSLWRATGRAEADAPRRADRAEAALERVKALHRKALAVFSWSEGGVRYEEPCENCNGAPGVHACGCWADEQTEYVCAECDRDKGKNRDSTWPCATIQAIEGADDD